MSKFRSLVIFDLETTGLPHLEYNLTKITELSLVSCLLSHCNGEKLPRVMNKLTLVVNHNQKIQTVASEKTGLCNELLKEYKPFDDDMVFMLDTFLRRLPQPVCLIAHNGNRFDFPIFKKHLVSCNASLKSDIFCADSLSAFKSIFPKCKRNSNKVAANENESTVGNTDDDNNSKTLESYKLSDIYKYLHGDDAPNLHSSENDCIALLSCINKCREEFGKWLNSNAEPLFKEQT